MQTTSDLNLFAHFEFFLFMCFRLWRITLYSKPGVIISIAISTFQKEVVCEKVKGGVVFACSGTCGVIFFHTSKYVHCIGHLTIYNPTVWSNICWLSILGLLYIEIVYTIFNDGAPRKLSVLGVCFWLIYVICGGHLHYFPDSNWHYYVVFLRTRTTGLVRFKGKHHLIACLHSSKWGYSNTRKDV